MLGREGVELDGCQKNNKIFDTCWMASRVHHLRHVRHTFREEGCVIQVTCNTNIYKLMCKDCTGIDFEHYKLKLS